MGHERDDEKIGHAEVADRAGLVHILDEGPGIRRRRRGRGWSYHTPDGELIRDEERRARLVALAIPPAWTDVWICPDPDGHIQATGRDDRGRKQYRYHERWNEVRDLAKFERLHEFGRALPRIRAAVDEALAEPDLGRRKVLAAVLALLDATAIRVGNDAYARENGTFGLTTIRRRHIEIEGPRIVFRFEGKGRKTIEVSLRDERLARVVEACRDLPGYEVFKWIDDDGKRHDVRSDDVNEFIRELAGSDFTAKNFRTWLGTLEAFRYLRASEEPADDDELNERRLAAVDAAAARLQNTREVARDGYVHPVVLDRFPWSGADDPAAMARSRKGKPKHLTRDEWALLVLLDGCRRA